MAERSVARLLGGKRIPINGRGSSADITNEDFPWLASEVKNREVVPKWLTKGMSQAQAAATKEQLPVVIVHEVGSRYLNSLVVVRLADFKEWFGAP